MDLFPIAIIGAGLAGTECALALARQGIPSSLFEMKPQRFSPAHCCPECAELVCSNSFRSESLDSAVGILKHEMRCLGSAVLSVAEECRVPAGKSLAVDRKLFSRFMTRRLEAEPLISLIRQEVYSLDAELCSLLKGFAAIVVAAGPLISEDLARSLQSVVGADSLFFYDAVAPVIDGAKIDSSRTFWAGRYGGQAADYLNCPMNRDEYFAFYHALLAAEKVKPRSFEQLVHFEGCMPIESLAERGEMTLAFGPLKPVGLLDPVSGTRPFAVLQLRTENINKTMFNLVGCQTRLTYPEQQRVFRMVPGLEQAEFVRYGSMHRNTYVCSPRILEENLSLRTAPHIFLAGQITGVEGYVESAASGLWLGLSLAAQCFNSPLPLPPQETALGALLRHLSTEAKRFQPSNVQFGLMPALQARAKKAERRLLYAERAQKAFQDWKATYLPDDDCSC